MGIAAAIPELTMNGWLRFDAIRQCLRRVRPQRVLEVGTGEGALSAWLATRYDYVGVEHDSVARATAQARLEKVGRGRIVESLDAVRSELFDLVCAFEVLEHIEEDSAALREWALNLRPSGSVLLSMPAHQRRFGAWDEMVGHLRRYERHDLDSTLRAGGFETTRIFSYGAGLGSVLEQGRNFVARRRAGPARVEDRTAASGRLLQTHSATAAFANAIVTAPFRLLQAPLAQTEAGIGYVALAERRS